MIVTVCLMSSDVKQTIENKLRYALRILTSNQNDGEHLEGCTSLRGTVKMRREQESRTDLRVTLLVVHVSFCRDVQIFFLFKKKNLTRLLTALLKSTGIQNRKLRHERKFTNV